MVRQFHLCLRNVQFRLAQRFHRLCLRLRLLLFCIVSCLPLTSTFVDGFRRFQSFGVFEIVVPFAVCAFPTVNTLLGKMHGLINQLRMLSVLQCVHSRSGGGKSVASFQAQSIVKFVQIHFGHQLNSPLLLCGQIVKIPLSLILCGIPTFLSIRNRSLRIGLRGSGICVFNIALCPGRCIGIICLVGHAAV